MQALQGFDVPLELTPCLAAQGHRTVSRGHSRPSLVRAKEPAGRAQIPDQAPEGVRWQPRAGPRCHADETFSGTDPDCGAPRLAASSIRLHSP
jgi:hypothetical protein